jgi:hypothetical protein
MTYTVTKTYTKPDDATLWPWEKDGYDGGLDNLKSEGKLTSLSESDDGNTHTRTQIWASKSDWDESISDAVFQSASSSWKTYMSLNNISCRIVEEDGTVLVFNSSTKFFEAE